MANTRMTDNTRVYVNVSTVSDWYQIIRDANARFGKNWRGQKRVKRKLENPIHDCVTVWFDVPDPAFATYVQLKYGGLK